MLDLNAPIIPARGAAGITLGRLVSDLADTQLSRMSEGAGGRVHDLGPVRVWIRNGVIDQISVRTSYAGSIGTSGIGIGSTLQELATALGPVLEDDEDSLVVAGVPGVCFETEQWSGEPGHETVDENLSARITEIFVFSP